MSRLMARPPLAMGTHGSISVTKRAGSSAHVARCRFRDFDGVSWASTRATSVSCSASWASRRRTCPTSSPPGSGTRGPCAEAFPAGWPELRPGLRRRLCAPGCVAYSAGQVGTCADNAAMESFFSLLQKNVLNRGRWTTRHDLRLAIITWIETTYHRRRHQDTLGRLTPVEFETLRQAAYAG
jgi:hypothetical protein